MKKLLLAGLFLVFLAGCGRDASQLTVVTGIGVDGRPGDYIVGTEVIRLTGGEQSSQSVLLKADGQTVTDGIDSLVALTGRSLYSNHAQVLVIGRETAENDMILLLEELLRVNQYPVSLRVAVAKETAAEIMNTKAVVSDLQSTELEDMIRQGAEQCLTADMDLCTFYQDMKAPGIEGVLPFLELREDNGEQVCVLAGSALFRDDKLAVVLDREDSRTLMWMRGRHGGTLMTEHGLLEITFLKRKLEAKPDHAKLTLEITLTAAGNENHKDAIRQDAQTLLETRCRSLLSQLQALECDAVGFGRQLRRHRPKAYNSLQQPWAQAFREYPITVEVRVNNILWGRIWSEEGEHGT